ncbi:MAG: WG repeat-containing protein [Acidobacteriia bacterium]|nr:WG repeat-containing protein [Terriglobia bacterium]
MIPKRITSITLGVWLSVSQIPGCSWDYSVWPKSKRSDTALFRFVVNERYGAGYINGLGRIVIPPQYLAFGNHGGDFFEGLANVKTKDDGDFYIDATGKRVAPSNYLSDGDFSEGLATRWFRDEKKYGFIDHSGKLAIPATFDYASSFAEGLAVVKLEGRFGYIDHSGKLAIPARFSYAAEFSDGLALVVENGPCQHIGYGPCEYPLNPPIIMPAGVSISPNTSRVPRCRYSVIDLKGQVLFTSDYIDAKHFAEGLAPMGDGTKWGYVDYSGKVRIPLQFDAAEPFSEGLARVFVGHKYGFIDRTGAFVIQPQFFLAQDFSEGFAVVSDENNKYSFINTSGKRAIAGEFDGASDFVMGLAHVRVGKGYYSATWSYIDKTGKVIFSYSDHSNRGQRRP